ncbi:hypothetical protein CCHL11_02510 [Colletotrichum chlorophyti]|uniref:Uncharacterized protein n=1 Tax=Colletotrichum chlorophyti TaxID=708187 RepID=A0A1Q8S8V2_9PEZI|nr:hypothetical protein CCHL11_02510 [Colletotrichum chlorophyti]
MYSLCAGRRSYLQGSDLDDTRGFDSFLSSIDRWISVIRDDGVDEMSMIGPSGFQAENSNKQTGIATSTETHKIFWLETRHQRKTITGELPKTQSSVQNGPNEVDLKTEIMVLQLRLKVQQARHDEREKSQTGRIRTAEAERQRLEVDKDRLQSQIANERMQHGKDVLKHREERENGQEAGRKLRKLWGILRTMKSKELRRSGMNRFAWGPDDLEAFLLDQEVADK